MKTKNRKCNELINDKLIITYIEKTSHYISVLGALVSKTAIDQTLRKVSNSTEKYWFIAIVLLFILIILYIIAYFSKLALYIRIRKLETTCVSEKSR